MLFLKLISDSGFEGEINNVAVASHQVEVFAKVFKTTVVKFVEEGIEMQQKNLKEIIVSLQRASIFIIAEAFISYSVLLFCQP